MAMEIERRFLVKEELIAKENTLDELVIIQGYLNKIGDTNVVRIRHTTRNRFDTEGYITLKQKRSHGVSREYEYEIPAGDATELLRDCLLLISKRREILGRFEIDYFGGELEGMIIAEIELDDILEEFEKPDWLGKEITGIDTFSNFRMALDPKFAKQVYDNLVSTGEVLENKCLVCGKPGCKSLDCVPF